MNNKTIKKIKKVYDIDTKMSYIITINISPIKWGYKINIECKDERNTPTYHFSDFKFDWDEIEIPIRNGVGNIETMRKPNSILVSNRDWVWEIEIP